MIRQLLVATSLTLSLLSPVDAQCVGLGCNIPPGGNVSGGSHTAALGINAGLGALTVALGQAIRRDLSWREIAEGAGGGSIVYFGKRTASAEFSGSGMLGRQIASVGTSIVANSSRGDPALSALTLSFGPARMEVRLSQASDRIRTRIDAVGAAYIVYSAFQPETRIDWSSSLSAGTAVFVDSSPPEDWGGRHVAGVILLKDTMHLTREAKAAVLRHESVHVLQHDFTYGAWGRPAESWLLSRVRGGKWLHDRAEFRSDLLLWAVMESVFPYRNKPSEMEANFFVPGVTVLRPQ